MRNPLARRKKAESPLDQLEHEIGQMLEKTEELKRILMSMGYVPTDEKQGEHSSTEGDSQKSQ